MIIRIFKISTMSIWTLPNKSAFIEFVARETGKPIPINATIDEIEKYLPVEDYYRVKQTEV